MSSDDLVDPAEDRRSDYDYQNETVERPNLVNDLRERVEGDVRFDEYSRQLYATDASAYEVTPIGVVFPKSTQDVVAVMEYCSQEGIPVLPRGGGTSLAGQAVNEAVVLDFTRYLDSIIEINPEEETVVAQPGVILGDLNAELSQYGLKFAPDPAWGDKSALGGAIGNNSTGAHSLKYGKTDAYIEEVEVVLADGTLTQFGETPVEDLRRKAGDAGLQERIYTEIVRIIDEESEAIKEVYPELKRNVSGYNLDCLVDEAREGTVNMGRVLAGSEGTLAVVTEAKIALEPVPETKSMALLAYNGLIDAMEDVSEILKHDPAAVEVLDDVLIDLASETEEFEGVVSILPEGTKSVLLVEFYAESEEKGREKVKDLIEDRLGDETAHAFEALEAHTEKERNRFWKLRKSGLPILLSRTSDSKHISFIEDTAIPPENLPEYVEDFQEILDEHDTFASFYAHAGPGCLHIRPLINTKTRMGLERMHSIADDVTDLVVEYGGSVSGEHGDGRARTQWNRKLYGEHVWNVFRDLKSAFDPDWLLNPGQVCGDIEMTENLRFDPEYTFDAGFEPELRWGNENGFQGMVELCHGCGGCRGKQDTTGGVMCPTFRASKEEITSTRGRANMLRQAMSGDLPQEEVFTDEFVSEVMDLCIGCKGCARDCPSEVDMAKLKAEVEYEYKKRNGAPLRDRIFAEIDLLSSLGSKTAPLSNWATKVPGVGIILEHTLGIARERSLPRFHRESLERWFDKREPKPDSGYAENKVVLFPDTYTNYNDPGIGKAAVEVLESAGVRVEIPDGVVSSGRPAHSKGFLDKARARARKNVDVLSSYVRDGWDIAVVEPSDAVMLQSDYLDLLSGNDVELVAGNTYGVMEYIDVFDIDVSSRNPSEILTYHGHCHQKATKKDIHAPSVLRMAGYDVNVLDSGCCGMAGSFGYEAEHYSMSKAIGRLLYSQVDRTDADVLVAPGASCRTQLGDRYGYGRVAHPVEKLAEAAE